MDKRNELEWAIMTHNIELFRKYFVDSEQTRYYIYFCILNDSYDIFVFLFTFFNHRIKSLGVLYYNCIRRKNIRILKFLISKNIKPIPSMELLKCTYETNNEEIISLITNNLYFTPNQINEITPFINDRIPTQTKQ